MIDTDYIHPLRGAKLGAGHSEDRLIVDKFVLFKNDTDKGIVIANKDLYATEVIDIGED